MRTATLLAAAVAFAAISTNAHAGVSVDIGIYSGPPRAYCPPPAYGTRIERVWVPPVTQAVTQSVWHEPVTEDRVDRQWVPDRYDVRDVPVTDSWGRSAVVRQTVLVEPAHWQEVRTPVVVRAGYYAPETQVVTVRPGYWQTVERPVVFQPDFRPVIVGPPPVYRDDRFRGRYDDRRGDDRHYDGRGGYRDRR